MKTYDEFWAELSQYYPISHWELRLPIATRLTKLQNLDINWLLDELKKILEELLKNTNEQIKNQISETNWDNNLKKVFEWNYSWVIRFDCVINQENKPKLIEINADYPDGLLMHDATFSLLKWEKTTTNLDNYLKLFNKEETIFIIYKKWTFFLDAYYTEYELLKKLWFKVFIWNYEDLEFRWENIYFEWEKIDVIRRCMEVGKFEETFFDNLSEKNIRFVNTFDIRVLWYKNLLSTIDHNLVPKTFILSQENAQIAIENKDNYVIKPSNLFEWKWVCIWKDTQEEDWKKNIMDNLENNFVVQEYVDISKIDIDFYDDWKIVSKNLYFDFCPHFFINNWKVTGKWLILARFSENKILNVAMWWWIWYIDN